MRYRDNGELTSLDGELHSLEGSIFFEDIFLGNILEICKRNMEWTVWGLSESRRRCEENVSISSQIEGDEEICSHQRIFEHFYHIFSLSQVFITLFSYTSSSTLYLIAELVVVLN